MTALAGDRSYTRVLVIDDQAEVRTWVRGVLKRMGVTDVTEAANGHDAIATVTAGGWFDLILCDLQMPVRDGIETIRAFAALGLESAIAIMSVEEERVIEAAAMFANLQGLRMIGVIPKPVTAEKLKPILDRLADAPSQRVEDSVVAPAADFANAFARAELVFFYQPKVWTQTGELAGVEALVRWKHPELGLFQPAAFVPFMEANAGHDAALAEFSLQHVIACAGRWRQRGRELPVAINLSVTAFNRLDLPDRIASIARDAGVPPGHVTLEITETKVARDAVRVIDVATRLRLKGFRLSIDDFGMGQSGLAQLQKLPFTELKIDRSFVHGCSASATQRSVVEASLALARSLKMTAVAEGVQNRGDWGLLRELECDVLQGYLIGRPVSEDGLEAWLARWTPRDR
jgi:EAL domain-containing protein (putative c-di-GMP-specific phosphodiesterase class I)/FixJ family two-component response regulator